MTERTPFNLGLVAGALLSVGGQALHWFITPHPDASSARVIAVALQALLSFGAAAGIYLYYRRVTHTPEAA